jgi:hypothetical protein
MTKPIMEGNDPPHPNLMPVIIRNKAELELFGGQMRNTALNKPAEKPHTYSKDAAELKEIVEGANLNLNDSYRFSRHAIVGPHYLTLSCTFDKDQEPPRWHLSMTHHTPGQITRASDQICNYVVPAIIGEGWEEIPNPSTTIPEIRHFIRIAE